MENKVQISKKQFSKMVLPSMGDHLHGGLFKVIYVNKTKFWFTGTWNTVRPDVGYGIKIEDRTFQVKDINDVKKTFTAVFTGIEQQYQKTPDAPDQGIEPVKLI